MRDGLENACRRRRAKYSQLSRCVARNEVAMECGTAPSSGIRSEYISTFSGRSVTEHNI